MSLESEVLSLKSHAVEQQWGAAVLPQDAGEEVRITHWRREIPGAGVDSDSRVDLVVNGAKDGFGLDCGIAGKA